MTRRRRAPLVIVGAGGFARETAQAVASINALRPTWELLGFVDDEPALHGTAIDGVPVLGPVDAAADIDAWVVVCTGNPGNYFSRKRLVRRLPVDADRFATIVHPGAWLAPTTEIGRGSVVLAGVVTTAAVTIGAHVAVMPATVLTHGDEVDDYVTFAAGVRLGGDVSIGEGAYVGSGAMVRERRRVGAWALVGMGSVVTHDVPTGEVWAGIPARRRRDVSVPLDVVGAGV